MLVPTAVASFFPFPYLFSSCKASHVTATLTHRCWPPGLVVKTWVFSVPQQTGFLFLNFSVFPGHRD